jgi:hypothetical protein
MVRLAVTCCDLLWLVLAYKLYFFHQLPCCLLTVARHIPLYAVFTRWMVWATSTAVRAAVLCMFVLPGVHVLLCFVCGRVSLRVCVRYRVISVPSSLCMTPRYAACSSL